MEKTININDLSAADKKALMLQLAKEEKEAKAERENEIRLLKKMIDEQVNQKAPVLAEFGKDQTKIVASTFNDFSAVIALKNDLYGVKETQASHTFSSRDGNGSITIGFNEMPSFDATVDVGLKKIHTFLGSLSKDDANRIKIEKVVETLTKKNKKGELNPTKVISLSDLKADMNDELFSEGVDIVVNSQFKTRTGSFVRGWFREKQENGSEVKLTFSISTVNNLGANQNPEAL